MSHAFPKDGVVYTVNYPLQFFAKAIGGDDLDVVFPTPPDVDPADWTPDVDTLLDYQLTGRPTWIRSSIIRLPT